MTRTSTRHLLVLAVAAALALCFALASAGGQAALAKSGTVATKRDDNGGARKAAGRRCARGHREDRRADRHGRKCKKAHHARHGRGADDRRASTVRGADDPVGDDHGSGGHGADDGPGHT
jgi:hypothetical protein